MADIRVVSFDLDGTLTDLWGFDKTFWHEEVPRLIAERHRIPLEEAKRRMHADVASLGGEYAIEYYFPDHWFSHFDLPKDWKRVMHDMQHLVTVFPDVIPSLARLKIHFPLIVLSNSPREFIDMKMKVERLGGLFDHTISAVSDYKMVKRDPVIYQKIIERFKVRPDQIVHIGDHEAFDYQAARDAGLRAFWLNHDRTVKGDHIVHSISEFADKVFELAGIYTDEQGTSEYAKKL